MIEVSSDEEGPPRQTSRRNKRSGNAAVEVLPESYQSDVVLPVSQGNAEGLGRSGLCLVKMRCPFLTLRICSSASAQTIQRSALPLGVVMSSWAHCSCGGVIIYDMNVVLVSTTGVLLSIYVGARGAEEHGVHGA